MAHSHAQRHCKMIGSEIKAVQFGWPSGMPLARKLDNAQWEIRVGLGDTIARILFTVVGSTMVLLHGFVKKSQKTPIFELMKARQRKAALRGWIDEQTHRL